jgi:hypothetical protein
MEECLYLIGKVFFMPESNPEVKSQTDPIEEARKNFEYAKQMAHLAKTIETLDYWNAEIDRTRALLDKAIQEDEEKNGGLKIRVFDGYEATLDFGADKKAKQESDIDPAPADDSNTQVIPYSPAVRLPELKPQPHPLPHTQPIKEAKNNSSGSNNSGDVRKDKGNEKNRIIKVALALLGHTTPDDLDLDKNPLYKKVAELYDCTKIDLLSRYDWKFAIVRAKLRNLGKCQENRYMYELPWDLLKIQQIIPNCNYSREGGNIFSYTDNLALLYVCNVKDSSFPEFFKILLTYSLAAVSAALITQNETIARKWELEAGQRFCIAVANDTAEQATHGISRNSIYTSHFY